MLWQLKFTGWEKQTLEWNNCPWMKFLVLKSVDMWHSSFSVFPVRAKNCFTFSFVVRPRPADLFTAWQNCILVFFFWGGGVYGVVKGSQLTFNLAYNHNSVRELKKRWVFEARTRQEKEKKTLEMKWGHELRPDTVGQVHGARAGGPFRFLYENHPPIPLHPLVRHRIESSWTISGLTRHNYNHGRLWW